MGIQIPLLVIDWRSRLGHVCMVPEPVGSTHLRFGDARVVMGNGVQLLNVVRSPG